MRHLIKKQILELTLDKRVNYFRVQQELSDHYWKQIVPILEKAFDAISNEDELIEIDKLELDLGVVSETELGEEEWNREIKKKIEEKIATMSNPSSAHYAIRSRDRRLGVFDQWLYYMQHGYLAWNSRQVDDQWHLDVLEAIAVDSRSHRRLQTLILQDPHLLKRIVAQHPISFLQKLTEIITAEKQFSFAGYMDELLLLYRHLQKKKKISGDQKDAEFKSDSWQQILRWTAASPLGSLTDKLVRFFVDTHRVTTKVPSVLEEKLTLSGPMVNHYAGELKDRLGKEKKQIAEIVDRLPDRGLKELKEIAENESLSKYNARALDEEGVFVVHAGTVLLHPFLKSLFTRLQLMEENAFADLKAQERSLYLIHYLATGNTEPKEYELMLAKLLCAWPMETPVPTGIDLPAAFLQEADDMLTAVIDQWEILKSTSASGLREGFLQRPGKLSSKNGNLYLRVEKSAVDILLDYLPWGLSMVRLPWMKDILRVEWR
jgi:hypothetical protein